MTNFIYYRQQKSLILQKNQPAMNQIARPAVIITESRITFSIASKCDNDWFMINKGHP